MRIFQNCILHGFIDITIDFDGHNSRTALVVSAQREAMNVYAFFCQDFCNNRNGNEHGLRFRTG